MLWVLYASASCTAYVSVVFKALINSKVLYTSRPFARLSSGDAIMTPA